MGYSKNSRGCRYTVLSGSKTVESMQIFSESGDKCGSSKVRNIMFEEERQAILFQLF